MGINPQTETGWVSYCIGLVIFNLLGLLLVFVIQKFQFYLPFNPQEFSGVSTDSSLNTAVSFVTNTNWQGYSGESTMSYFTQMMALTVQNFLSAATGIVVVIVMIRGFVRKSVRTIGNVWVDLTRTTLWILLPLSIIFSVLFAGQGVIQNLSPYTTVQTVETQNWQEPVKSADGETVLDTNGAPKLETVHSQTQTLPMGPGGIAAFHQIAGNQRWRFFQRQFRTSIREPDPVIKLFANDLHFPDTGLPYASHSDEWQVTWRQGIAIMVAMYLIFIVFAIAAIYFEQMGNPRPVAPWNRPDTGHCTGRRKHGRQGNPARHCRNRPFHCCHDRRFLWRDQRHDGFPDPTWRSRSPCPHATG